MLSPLPTLLPLAAFAWPAVALAAVVALILLAQRAVRSFWLQRRNEASRLTVIEALAIDPRRRLHLVRCDDRTVILLTGGAQDLVVGWLQESGS